MPKKWILNCRVELIGATMIVEADTEEEAMAKARANKWKFIEYDRYELNSVSRCRSWPLTSS